MEWDTAPIIPGGEVSLYPTARVMSAAFMVM